MDNTPSSLNGDKNPFAELTDLGDLSTPTKKVPKISLLTVAFVWRIVATILVGCSVIFAADAFVRSSDTRPSFIPASLGGYLSMGVLGESNENGLTLSELTAKYNTDTQSLLDLYAHSATDLTYQRSLVEFFEKNPEVEFIETQNAQKYNILTLLGEFTRITQSNTDSGIKYDCQVDSVSDAGELKANCKIYSQHVLSTTNTKSARLAAAELAETFASSKSPFILKNIPKSLPLQEANEGSYKSQSSLSLDLQALPSLLP